MAPKTPPYSRPTKSSQLRNEARLDKQSQSPEDTATNEDLAGSFTAPTSTTASTRGWTVKNATVRDADFEDTQLIPRGIEICRTADLSLGSVEEPTPILAPKRLRTRHANFTDPSFRRALQEELNGR